MTRNLNDVRPENAESEATLQKTFVDNSCRDGETQVYFRDIEDRLIEHVRQADLVVGCVAWLTNKRVLQALAEKRGVSIIVQKEDFLRPDVGAWVGDWKRLIRERYDALRGTGRLDYRGTAIHDMSTSCDPDLDAVRCVGNYNREKVPAHPRMHNKFLVFAKSIPNYIESYLHEGVKPYAVWTGSFNVTENATMSLENALYLTNPNIVQAYYREWGQIAALSEPLDWRSDWSAPEWRLGT